METLRMLTIMAGPINLLIMVVVLSLQNQELKAFLVGVQMTILLGQILGIVYLFANR